MTMAPGNTSKSRMSASGSKNSNTQQPVSVYQPQTLATSPVRRLTLWHGIGVGNGKRLLGHVRHHEDGRAVPEKLADHGARVRQALELVHVQRRGRVALAHRQVLLAHA